MLAISLLYTAFIMFRYVPYIHILSKMFIMKDCYICKGLSASNEIITKSFLLLVSLYGGLHWQIFLCWTILDFLELVPLDHIGSSFYVYLDSVCEFLLVIFTYVFLKETDP